MYVYKDGTTLYFCNSKCKKNYLKLKREGRLVKWTNKEAVLSSEKKAVEKKESAFAKDVAAKLAEKAAAKALKKAGKAKADKRDMQLHEKQQQPLPVARASTESNQANTGLLSHQILQVIVSNIFLLPENVRLYSKSCQVEREPQDYPAAWPHRLPIQNRLHPNVPGKEAHLQVDRPLQTRAIFLKQFLDTASI